ncbi:MAG: hypothetical protein AAGH41_12750 [Pseudomonadota bacterium]
MNRIVLLPLCLAFLAACASTSAYGPASGDGFGYSEQAIEAGRFRVTYKASNPSAAENGALRRAAELTKSNGFDYFKVVSRDLQRERSRSNSSVGIGGGTGGRRGGVGVGVSVPLGGGSERTTARLEVVMFKGERPDEPESYDAASILSNLGG